MVEYIQEHFNKDGFGLWAVEVPGVAPLIGFTGLSVPGFSTHFHAMCGSRLVPRFRSS
jgi:RimJ/RimL family protein N-acetyltransferase